jgi:ferredoxin
VSGRVDLGHGARDARWANLRSMMATPLRRPTAMRIDAVHCVRCGHCDALLPGVLTSPERIPVSPTALEAMAACPTGAIVWCEQRGVEVAG